MNLSRRAVLAGGAGVLATHRRAEERMTHIVLLGDSVIDNKSYVGQGPDVAEQLRVLAPKEWEVTRLAMDGAVSSDVLRQIENLPAVHAPSAFTRMNLSRRAVLAGGAGVLATHRRAEER